MKLLFALTGLTVALAHQVIFTINKQLITFLDLAEAVVKVTKQPSNFKFLYPLDETIESKIRSIAQNIYGADDVSFTEEAQEKINLFTKQGFGNLPICMAKTQYSLSHDAALKVFRIIMCKNYLIAYQ